MPGNVSVVLRSDSRPEFLLTDRRYVILALAFYVYPDNVDDSAMFRS
jgi:hypothetical protein